MISVLPAARPAPLPAPPRSAVGCPAPPANLSTGGAAPEPAPAPLIGRAALRPVVAAMGLPGATGRPGPVVSQGPTGPGRTPDRPRGCGMSVARCGQAGLSSGKGIKESAYCSMLLPTDTCTEKEIKMKKKKSLPLKKSRPGFRWRVARVQELLCPSGL